MLALRIPHLQRRACASAGGALKSAAVPHRRRNLGRSIFSTQRIKRARELRRLLAMHVRAVARRRLVKPVLVERMLVQRRLVEGSIKGGAAKGRVNGGARVGGARRGRVGA